MRIGFIAVLGVMAFSPPPCQKHNENFMNDDAGGTGSSADTSGEAPTTHDDTDSGSASGPSSTDADATDDVGETTISGTDSADDATSEATAESTGASDDGPCPEPEQLCGNICIDTTTNDDHCGECGHKCHPVMETCQDSVCVQN